MQIIKKIKKFYAQFPRLSIGIGVGTVAIIGFLIFGRGSDTGAVATFEARRGDLNITVVEGGTVEALESQEIRCEVAAGYQGTKIIRIVEEGYFVTDEDVKNGLVLVELDSSDLRDRLMTQEIQYQSSLATLTEARQNFDIQFNQSQTDVKTAEQTAKFAYMDFAKYVGDKLASEVVAKLGMREQTNTGSIDLSKLEGVLQPLLSATSSSTNGDKTNNYQNGEKSANTLQNGEWQNRNFRRSDIDSNGSTSSGEERSFGQRSGGQRSPRRTNQVTMYGSSPQGQPDLPARGTNMTANSAAENGRTTSSIATTRQSTTLSAISAIPDDLFSVLGSNRKNQTIDFSQYAKPELLGDGSAKQQLRSLLDSLQVSIAQESLDLTTLQGKERLFKKGFISKSELDSVQMTYTNTVLRVATARTALDLFIKYEFPKQAETLLSDYDQKLRALERTRKEAVSKIAQSLARLRASEGSYKIQAQQREELIDKINKCTIRAQKSGLVVYATDTRYYGSNEQIREGATVRERQTILTIPDMKTMAVRVKIHESYIKRIQKGLLATVQVDAFPEDILNGEVTKVSVIPDSGSRWMNPDLKIYPTVVSIIDEREWLKPGMSAKVEIMVKRLTNVVYIPLQAVVNKGDKHICYVQNSFKPEMRIVEIGDFNDDFIEVKSGIKEGDRVLLQPPAQEKNENEEPTQEEDKKDENHRVPGETLKLDNSTVSPTSSGNGNHNGSMDSTQNGRSRRGGATQP
jgi:RND family efflux transporter MFP subunit